MARKAISVKGITYKRVKAYCDAQGRSISGYLEEVLAEKLDAAGVPVPVSEDPPILPKKKRDRSDDEIISQYFTF